jgi:hypothetical protein
MDSAHFRMNFLTTRYDMRQLSRWYHNDIRDQLEHTPETT